MIKVMTAKIDFDFQEVKLEKDFLKVLPLMKSLLTEEKNDITKAPSDKVSITSWKKAKTLGYRVYAARNGDEILGVMGLTENHDPLEEKKYFRLNNFIVEPDFRGLGIGTAMMKKAEQIARAEKAQFIVLEVLSHNKKAQKFYTKTLGYDYVCNRMLKMIGVKGK